MYNNSSRRSRNRATGDNNRAGSSELRFHQRLKSQSTIRDRSSAGTKRTSHHISQFRVLGQGGGIGIGFRVSLTPVHGSVASGFGLKEKGAQSSGLMPSGLFAPTHRTIKSGLMSGSSVVCSLCLIPAFLRPFITADTSGFRGVPSLPFVDTCTSMMFS